MADRRMVIPFPGNEAGPEPQRLSIVVPVYNEQDNIAPLLERIHAAMADVPWTWEVVLVDDGSTDATPVRLADAVEADPEHVCALIFRRNFGQTAAMQAGIDSARGSVIATLDGDLQNDPGDIARMVRRLLDEDLDLVAGWRRARQDNPWLRIAPSWLANRLIGKVTGVCLHDYGCSLKVFRADILHDIRLYGDMHRFIPTWIATITSPDRIREEPVRHAPRVHGHSKYGLSRTLRVMLDLLSMYFFMRFHARPGHFFGRIGVLCGLAGLAALGWLAWHKLVHGEAISGRPLLLAGILLTVVGVQFISTGIVTEMLARTYYESTGNRSYAVRRVLGRVRGKRPPASPTGEDR